LTLQHQLQTSYELQDNEDSKTPGTPYQQRSPLEVIHESEFELNDSLTRYDSPNRTFTEEANCEASPSTMSGASVKTCDETAGSKISLYSLNSNSDDKIRNLWNIFKR